MILAIFPGPGSPGPIPSAVNSLLIASTRALFENGIRFGRPENHRACRLFIENGEGRCANRNDVALHAAAPGKRKIHFPRFCTPAEESGSGYGRGDNGIEQGENKILRPGGGKPGEYPGIGACFFDPFQHPGNPDKRGQIAHGEEICQGYIYPVSK